jgi:exodeoxyribonuclease VII large subunit
MTDNDSHVFSVSSLLRQAKTVLESEFGMVWIEGEVSNLARPASGHLYFSLKDEKSQVRCALFRMQRGGLGINPENGMLVRVRARVSLYEPRGDFQLIVDKLEPAGIGALQQAFERLKQRLAAEGLFDTSHKKPFPAYPRRIGVITSASGAVIHDILTTLRRRFPAISVLIYPVPVQGTDAAPQIAGMIGLAAERRECDALILARGGGSLEDLWAFNEEIVARAIYDCPLPIVSSIGHETDFTIADFVADARAPTPTAAAEMLSPNGVELARTFQNLDRALTRAMAESLTERAQSVDMLSRRLVHPGQRIRQTLERLHGLRHRLMLNTNNRLLRSDAVFHALQIRLRNIKPLDRIQARAKLCRDLARRLSAGTGYVHRAKRMEFASLAKRLNTLNPLETLHRGFSIVYKEDNRTIVSSIKDLSVGDKGHIRFADGQAVCKIENLSEKTN